MAVEKNPENHTEIGSERRGIRRKALRENEMRIEERDAASSRARLLEMALFPALRGESAYARRKEFDRMKRMKGMNRRELRAIPTL